MPSYLLPSLTNPTTLSSLLISSINITARSENILLFFLMYITSLNSSISPSLKEENQV